MTWDRFFICPGPSWFRVRNPTNSETIAISWIYWKILKHQSKRNPLEKHSFRGKKNSVLGHFDENFPKSLPFIKFTKTFRRSSNLHRFQRSTLPTTFHKNPWTRGPNVVERITHDGSPWEWYSYRSMDGWCLWFSCRYYQSHGCKKTSEWTHASIELH